MRKVWVENGRSKGRERLFFMFFHRLAGWLVSLLHPCATPPHIHLEINLRMDRGCADLSTSRAWRYLLWRSYIKAEIVLLVMCVMRSESPDKSIAFQSRHWLDRTPEPEKRETRGRKVLSALLCHAICGLALFALRSALASGSSSFRPVSGI
jgi:hypothetical protein